MSIENNEEYVRLREFAQMMNAEMPESFAVDMLLLLYQHCMAEAMPLDETLDIFGPASLNLVTAAVYTAPRENPDPIVKINTIWPHTYVVTQLGEIGKDGVMRPLAETEDSSPAFLFQELFRRRRSGGN